MMKLSHTALFLAAAVVLLATGLPTSPKEVLESIGKADTIVPEGEAAAVEITQKAQTHNNHKDAAPKLGGLQMSRGGLNQPCKTDPSIGSFCDSVYISDTLASLEAKCVYGVDHGTVYGFDHTSTYSCNPGPAGCEKNDCYYRWMYGSCQCDVCKCVKPAPKPAPLCKFVYPCFNDMHKFDNSRYMSPDGNMCALSIVDQDSPDGVRPCQREENSRRYEETQQAKDLQMACKKELKCPTGCTVTPRGFIAKPQSCEGGRILDLDSDQWWTLVK